MSEDAQPIAYTALTPGVPVRSSSGQEFGTMERVLQIPEQDLFDGIVVTTAEGSRFVDADQVVQITTSYVECTVTDDEAAHLPEPSGSPVFRADATRDVGSGWKNRLGRLFHKGRWNQEQ